MNNIRHQLKILIDQLQENSTYLSDLQGRVNIERIIYQKIFLLKQKIIPIENLKTGDILLSLKSNRYLEEHFKSKRIVRKTLSHVTHVALAVKISFRKIKLIDVSSTTQKLKVRGISVYPGQILIVLRPLITNEERAKLLSVIKKYLIKKAKYSKAKLESLIIPLTMEKLFGRFSKRKILQKNPASFLKNQFFCSEFINQVFLESGVLLTPKSRNSSMVFPSDIAVSPMLGFVGIMVNESQKSYEELSKNFEGEITI